MNKFLAGILTIVLMLTALVAVAQAPRTDREALEAIAQILVEQGIVLPTTTTTQPTTTTTAAPTTTTTAAPTTTTVPPTTTTTAPTLPETLSYGQGGKVNAYSFFVSNLNTGNQWWKAPYFFDTPYAPGVGWGVGDKIGYRCNYGFIIEGGTKQTVGPNGQQDIIGGQVFGGYAVVRTNVPAGVSTYIKINDEYMIEGGRLLDGTYVGNYGTQTAHVSACDAILKHEYGEYLGPDQRPRIAFFTPSGELAEIRDYRNTVLLSDDIRGFVLLDGDGSDGEVAVGAVGADNKIAAIVYYYGLNGGTVIAVLP